MIASYFFTVIAYILLISIVVLNFLAQKNYRESKVIYIKNPSPVCTYGDNTIFVRRDTLNQCKDKSGKIIDDYFTFTEGGLKFVVTDKEQSFYMKICNKFCGPKNRLTNGNCKNPPANYQECIKLLQPPKNCKNPSQALLVDFKGNPYFASDIFPSKSLGCVKDY
jgi:hypothetical protein